MSNAKTQVRKDSINHVSQVPVHRWNIDQVRIWLIENRLTAFIDVFEENNVDGKFLLQLTHSILKEEFLINSFDDRAKILSALNRLSKGIFSIDEKAEKYILYKEKHANQQHTLSRRHSSENNNLSVPKLNTNFNNLSLNRNKSENNLKPAQTSATTPKQNIDDSIIGMYSNDIYGQELMMRNFSESVLPNYIDEEKIIHITKCPYGVVKHTKVINIEGICDAKSLMKTILDTFDIGEPITYWDLYITEEGSPLTENEVLWICKQNSTKYHDHYFLKRNNKMKFNPNFIPATKLEQIFGEKPPEHYVHRKLKKFTNERPPSELIASNISKYFSEENNRKSLKMIYDEDSAEGNVLKPDDRPALSKYNTSPRSNSDKHLNPNTSPYTKFNTIDRMQKITTAPKSSSNNDVYATIDRIPYKNINNDKYNAPSKGSSLDKYATIERDRLYSSEKDISGGKSSSNRYLSHKYHPSDYNKYHHDGKEPSVKSSSKSDKYSTTSRLKYGTVDRRKGDKHIHRHRRDSPSTERHRRDSPSTERHRRDSPSTERHRKQHSRNNSNNSGSNKLLSPEENFKITARKSSLNNPSIVPKPHTNSPLVSATKIEVKKSNSPASPTYSPADSSPSVHSSPKSLTSSASQSPKSSPISHSPKKTKEKEKDSEKDKDKPKEEKKSTVIQAPFKWKKGALIGSGSYGEVFLGMNQSNGELMAIKQVEFKDNGKADKFVQSLKQEIDILKDLHHKNIVQYYGSQSDEKYFDIFLEYVPGGSILSLLNNYGAFEELLIKNFIRQVLEGVNYLHGKGIVHRDIKGANILVDNKGIVKISDFGISKKVDENTVNMKSKMNNRTSFQGSIYWMAPEVIKQENYTGKADIWSIGCLVIEMITAKHPWEQLDQTAAIFKIGSNNKPPVPDGLSTELNDFITLTFELDFNKRPSASKLLTHKFIMNEDEAMAAGAVEDSN